MKSLGYGRLISLDNFRRPNFELVADILYFFCDRIESSIDLSDDISTKLKRVEFIKNCANILASKTQIRLKLKHLYKSDGYAVKELLKIAHFLNDANNTNYQDLDYENNYYPHHEANSMSISSNLNKLREYTNLGSKIVENGVKLHNLLNAGDSSGSHLNNNGNKVIIDQRIIRFLDEMSHNIESYDNVIKKNIEKKLNHLINDLDDNLNDLQENKLIEIKQNIRILHKKLKEKSSEYDRLNKRLLSLKNIRPAFIEEYEILESKNIEIYDLYCEKFRNLSYLQSSLDKYRVIEREKEMKTKKRLKSVQQKLREQEMKLLTNNNDGVDDLDVFDANNKSSRSRRQVDKFSRTPSMSQTNTNTNTNSQSASSGVTSTGSSSIGSPRNSMSGSGREDDDDGSIGSISDIGDEHMQF